MATQVQFRKGNTTQTSTFTGAVAEITVDTDKSVVVVHDGSTPGGTPLAKESALSSNAVFAQAAFNKANTASNTGDAAFIKANTASNTGDAAFIKANTAQDTADASFLKANSANVLAQAAFDKANSVTQQGFVTVAANGVSLVADSNNDTLTITSNVANGIFINSNASTDTFDLGLLTTGVSAGNYGNSTISVSITVDQFGRITAISNNAIAAADADPPGTAVALAIALG